MTGATCVPPSNKSTIVGQLSSYITISFKFICREMGAFLSRNFPSLFGSREMRILMVGLDAAGKTTILYKLKLNENVTTIPTIGKVIVCRVY